MNMSKEPETITTSTTQTETETVTGQQGWRRWSRLALLTFTLVGPIFGSTLERLRRQAATTTTALAENAQSRQVDLRELRERFDALTDESRERVAQQASYLRAQARQLKTQSRQLRKAIRKEARQRQKWLKQAREAGLDWSQEMLKRGEQLSSEAIERGGKVTHDLVERGQELSHDLAKRSRKVTRAKRGEELLEPVREHSRVWTVVGFGVGMIVAGAITYRFVRGRSARMQAENESIELAPNASMNGKVAVAVKADEEEAEQQEHTAAE